MSEPLTDDEIEELQAPAFDPEVHKAVAEVLELRAELDKADRKAVLCVKALERQRVLTAEHDSLIMAVGNKYPGETRFETALRYIKQAEQPSGGAKTDLKGES